MNEKVMLDMSVKPEVTPEAVRRFVSELAEVNNTIKSARSSLKEVVDSNDEILKIEDDISSLKEDKQRVLETNPVITGFRGELEDAMRDRKDLIRDAKRDGIPRGEIDLAIRALKKDLDIVKSGEIYASIADLID